MPESLTWLRSLPEGSLPEAISQRYLETRFAGAPVAGLRGWLALQPAGEGESEISQESLDKLGRYLSTAPRAARLPSVLQEAGFSAAFSAQILTAAGQGGGREVSGD